MATNANPLFQLTCFLKKCDGPGAEAAWMNKATQLLVLHNTTCTMVPYTFWRSIRYTLDTFFNTWFYRHYVVNTNQHSTHDMKKECSERVPTSPEYGPLGMCCKHRKTPTRPACQPSELLASIESLGLRELERRLSNFRPKGATAFLGWRGVSRRAPGIGKFRIHMATSKHRKSTNQETTNIPCIQTPR